MHRFILLSIFFCAAFIVKARDIVSFKISPTNHLPYLEVFVNNDSVPYNFLLDTGCSTVMVNADNKRLNNLLDLCLTDTVDYAHSTAVIKMTKPENILKIGSMEIDSVQISADNFATDIYDGIIGQSVLARFSKVAIFPDSKIVIFCNPGEALRIPNGVTLPLIKHSDVYGTNLQLIADSCKVVGNFMLDTGFNAILSINSDMCETYNLKTILKPVGNSQSADGSGLQGSELLAIAPRILFGNESMPLLPILLDSNSHETEWRTRFKGLIGYDLLKRFRMLWDYENLTITLTPSFDYFSPVTSINRQ